MPIIEKSTLVRPTENNSLTYIYPTTSADSVYYNEETQETVKEKIDMLLDGFNKLSDEMENMTYEALSIKEFTAIPLYVEKGNIVKSITFNFEFNRVPKIIQIKIGTDTYEVTNAANDFTVDGLDIKSSTKCTLIVYDNKNGYATKTVNLNLYRRYFYGAATEFDKLTSLSSSIKEYKNIELGIYAENNNYIYFCCPISNVNDKTVFNVGGFEGGFTLVGLTKLRTTCNESSFTVNNDGTILSLAANNIENTESVLGSAYSTVQTYAIYKSDNAGLGRTTIKIS